MAKVTNRIGKYVVDAFDLHPGMLLALRYRKGTSAAELKRVCTQVRKRCEVQHIRGVSVVCLTEGMTLSEVSEEGMRKLGWEWVGVRPAVAASAVALE